MCWLLSKQPVQDLQKRSNSCQQTTGIQIIFQGLPYLFAIFLATLMFPVLDIADTTSAQVGSSVWPSNQVDSISVLHISSPYMAYWQRIVSRVCLGTPSCNPSRDHPTTSFSSCTKSKSRMSPETAGDLYYGNKIH